MNNDQIAFFALLAVVDSLYFMFMTALISYDLMSIASSLRKK